MVRYGEGDWFAVPLRDHGFAVGIVARANPGGVLLGYFFGPTREEVPQIDEVAVLDPSDADMVRKFGDLGLRNGAWPLIGASKTWDRERWPMPTFARYEELTGRSYSVTYDASDPNRVVAESPTTAEVASSLPKDGLAGAGFIEIVLTDLLGGHS